MQNGVFIVFARRTKSQTQCLWCVLVCGVQEQRSSRAVEYQDLDDGGGHGCLQKFLDIGCQRCTTTDDEPDLATKGPLDGFEQDGLQARSRLRVGGTHECTNHDTGPNQQNAPYIEQQLARAPISVHVACLPHDTGYPRPTVLTSPVRYMRLIFCATAQLNKRWMMDDLVARVLLVSDTTRSNTRGTAANRAGRAARAS